MSLSRFNFVLIVGLILVFALPARAVVPTEEKPIVVLRALDKITARVEALEVQVGQPFRFGTLFITAHNCRSTPPEETPEAAAFLSITELKPGEQELKHFKGWMFASSPALSALEHPVYDIWVIGCKDAPTPPAPAPDPVPAADVPKAKK